jgi:hypothetical protein
MKPFIERELTRRELDSLRVTLIANYLSLYAKSKTQKRDNAAHAGSGAATRVLSMARNDPSATPH